MASVALRSLTHAAECLTDRREQEEVLEIFTKINKETGWRISFVFKELKEKWGWQDTPVAAHPAPAQTSFAAPPSLLQNPAPMQAYPQYSAAGMQPSAMPNTYPQAVVSAPLPSAPAAAQRRPPTGIVNPLFATADFTLATHPYQNVYVAPSSMAHQTTLLYH